MLLPSVCETRSSYLTHPRVPINPVCDRRPDLKTSNSMRGNHMRGQRAFLNITPRSNDRNQSTILRFLFQNGLELELYVQDFLNCCGWAAGDDLTLMEGFWYGLDDSIRFVMPMADPSWDLESYINFTLQIVGSAFTVGEVVDNLRSSPIITTNHQ